ncbi:hypothetical protein SEA_SCAP1_34 [Streptomyces phage Scap1]|uniref:Uncharacterized protein n=1 Tax=Streptomyces phage Scap1 TaxID=2041354 RepID=A0A2D1GP26_9CAUD|nr:hypothetical protein FDI71_gp34 [Streptomyces phage Scap1]ATN93683.1 hypothetical protein SEA_SCAP1_34 [Streptomyces phage Scap1]
MSAPKNVTPAEIKAMADEKKNPTTVPAQAKQLEDVQVDAVGALQDSLTAVEKNLMHVYGVGVDVRIIRDEDTGEFKVEVIDPDESKMKRFAGKAKGVFQRNKKLVLATAGLLVTSAVLKAIAARQVELEADEVVESSDDVSVDA